MYSVYNCCKTRPLKSPRPLLCLTNLDVEGVGRVGAQLADLHSCPFQRLLARSKHHAVVAWLARSLLAAVAATAHDVV